MALAASDLRPRLFVEAATLMSGMGNGITLITLPWIVLELTGEATAAAIVATAAALRAGLPLHRANGLHEAVWGIAYLVGPGVGGLLIGWSARPPRCGRRPVDSWSQSR
jgi:hypothetical protein